MGYCEHCEGQRFDRARVLRALRQIRRELRSGGSRDGRAVIEEALKTVQDLDLPHLELEEPEDEVIH